MIFGGTGNNTLTGGEGTNVFIHREGASDLITNYDKTEDIIILSSGKVAESLTSEDSEDVVLKIAHAGNDFGTITVQGGASKILTIYDEDYIAESKKEFLDVSNSYIKAAVKTFEEDEDTQSILKDGADSKVLAEIKAVDSELATK